MRLQVRKQLAIQDGLRLALSARELHVAYQPIVSLADRSFVGAEALLRWVHPERGAISPSEFIPVAERSGLIVPIGRWVMDTACKDMRPLRRDHGLYVAVNVSVRQLIAGGFAEWVEAALARSEMPASALTVEVTEGALMDEIDSVRVAFHRLRAHGVRVSIDDFGTGYSSLSRLQDLPIDVIKLDRAFVTDVDKRAEGRAMATAILQLSTAIGASIIAEGRGFSSLDRCPSTTWLHGWTTSAWTRSHSSSGRRKDSASCCAPAGATPLMPQNLKDCGRTRSPQGD
jgi:EAL domain-containing protein (putative c-di-GMP-specific phosphodiesterase class I)